MKSSKIPHDQVLSELEHFPYKPPSFNVEPSFPLNYLSDRQFEVLLYLLFYEEINKGLYKGIYDSIFLLPEGADRGRDSSLHHKGRAVGLIQCKRYSSKITPSDFAKEIIKFVIYSILDTSLISDPGNFKYYFAASSDFTENTLLLVEDFNKKIFEDSQHVFWANEVLKSYKSFEKISFEDIKLELESTLKSISIIKLNCHDISLMIRKNSALIRHFFSVESVITPSLFEEILDNKFKEFKINDLTDKDIKRLSERLDSIPENFRVRFGMVNFFGYNDKIFKRLFKSKHLGDILKEMMVVNIKFISSLFEVFQELVYEFHEDFVDIVEKENISPLVRQVAAPYLGSRAMIKVTEMGSPTFLISLMKKSNKVYEGNSIAKLKKNFIEIGSRVITGDFSDYKNPPHLFELKKDIALFIYSGFANTLEMEETFDKDIIKYLPILKQIEDKLEEYLPINPTIVLEYSNFMEDSDYFKEMLNQDIFRSKESGK